MQIVTNRIQLIERWVAPLGARWLATAISLLLAFLCPPALAEYRPAPGDVLDIAVHSVPELQRRVPVDPDGSISFPVIGTIAVEGLTLPELRAKIKAALGGRGVTLRGPGRDEAELAIDVDDIVVSVASFRPVYVKGDVARPGEYPYRGRMSIREALALAGDVSLLSRNGPELVLNSLDFNGEIEALWFEWVKERARVWRLNAEIGENVEDRDTVAKSVPMDAPVNRTAIAEIVELAAKQLESRQANYRRENAALDEIIAQLGEEITVTSAQVEAEEKSHEADESELSGLTALKEKGVVTSQRFGDARRAVLFSSTRILQASAKLNEAKRLKSERLLQQHKLSADRRTALYQELETATTRLGEIRARLRSVTSKLHVTTGNTLANSDGSTRAPKFFVHRRTAKGVERLVETESFELMPGDVVDVVSSQVQEQVQGDLAPVSK